jgi:hypothetical protein
VKCRNTSPIEDAMKKNIVSATAGLLFAGATLQAHALSFELSFIPGTSAQEQASFTAAAGLWSAQFTDSVTVKLTVGTSNLGPNILAQAGSRSINYSYTDVRNALAADVTSLSDSTAVANLPTGSSVGMLINRTRDNPNGSGSATPYVDSVGANNSTMSINAANARALGLSFGVGGVQGGCSDCDAYIEFSTSFTWDHDPSDGIGGDAYDFVGIASHEIGHALGFVSGVDVLDLNSPPNGGPFRADQFTFLNSLDLFRYSAQSKAAGVIDWTADDRDKYFSIDGGASVGPLFSTGETFGDGRQASHWKDDLGIGIMDPTADFGEKLTIGGNDVTAFDVIGWNVTAVPEPGTWAMFGLGLAAMGAYTRRSKS